MNISDFLYRIKPLPALLLIFLSLIVVGSIIQRCDKTETIIQTEYVYDTIRVEIKTEIPVPYKIYQVDTIRLLKYISIHDTVFKTSQIDTAAILADYFKIVEYKDTIQDESLKFYLNEQITQNRIIGRQTSYQCMEHTEIITYENRATLYGGLSFLQDLSGNEIAFILPTLFYENGSMYASIGYYPKSRIMIGAGLKIISW